MKNLIYILLVLLFAQCVDNTNEDQLYGNWQLQNKVVNENVILQNCDQYNKLNINDNPTREQWYPDSINGECKPFPLRYIDLYIDDDGRHIWIEGLKYDYYLKGNTLKLWYTAYDTDGSAINVVEYWKKTL